MKKLILALAASASMSALAADQFVYFGTYTKEGKSEGIYVSTFDSATGKLGAPILAAKMLKPSFVAIHPSKKFLFAVSELKEGEVSAFNIDAETGLLTLINTQPTKGGAPCHVSTDSSGRCVMIANYSGGSTASYAVGEDGSLSEASFFKHEGSKPSRAHSATPGPNDKFAFIADLGLDQVVIYKLDAVTGKMTKHGVGVVKEGSGPRHFAFHPNGKKAYVINEKALTVTGFDFDHQAGTLTEFQTISTISDADRSQKGLSTADVQVHPSGLYLYGSNRGHDTIVVFRIDPQSGKLTLVENENIQGKTPRGFGMDATGKFLLTAGQGSDSIAVFKINEDSGKLNFTGEKIEVGIPVCVKFLQR